MLFFYSSWRSLPIFTAHCHFHSTDFRDFDAPRSLSLLLSLCLPSIKHSKWLDLTLDWLDSILLWLTFYSFTWFSAKNKVSLFIMQLQSWESLISNRRGAIQNLHCFKLYNSANSIWFSNLGSKKSDEKPNWFAKMSCIRQILGVGKYQTFRN